jgi:hypothetical protein
MPRRKPRDGGRYKPKSAMGKAKLPTSKIARSIDRPKARTGKGTSEHAGADWAQLHFRLHSAATPNPDCPECIEKDWL